MISTQAVTTGKTPPLARRERQRGAGFYALGLEAPTERFEQLRGKGLWVAIDIGLAGQASWSSHMFEVAEKLCLKRFKNSLRRLWIADEDLITYNESYGGDGLSFLRGANEPNQVWIHESHLHDEASKRVTSLRPLPGTDR